MNLTSIGLPQYLLRKRGYPYSLDDEDFRTVQIPGISFLSFVECQRIELCRFSYLYQNAPVFDYSILANLAMLFLLTYQTIVL